MNLQSKFGYCIITQTLNITLCKRDAITDRQTEGHSDDPITRCPPRTFQAGDITKKLCPPATTKVQNDLDSLTCQAIQIICTVMYISELYKVKHYPIRLHKVLETD